MNLKNKNIILLGSIGLIAVVILTAILVLMSNNDEVSTLQQNNEDLNNLEDIYAKLTDFDRILEKPEITQEQRDNAIKNTRTFLSLCEQSYIDRNNNLPEWNEEEKTQYANSRVSYGASFEAAYEEANTFSRHYLYVDLPDISLYYVGSHNDSSKDYFKFNYQVSCAGLGAPGANFSTYRYNEQLATYDYNDFG